MKPVDYIIDNILRPEVEVLLFGKRDRVSMSWYEFFGKSTVLNVLTTNLAEANRIHTTNTIPRSPTQPLVRHFYTISFSYLFYSISIFTLFSTSLNFQPYCESFQLTYSIRSFFLYIIA